MEALINEIVVLDVESPFVYIGRLAAVSDKTVTLEDADVHDLRDSETTRERYILDSRIHGVGANRQRVMVRLEQVVSLSALQDVVE